MPPEWRGSGRYRSPLGDAELYQGIRDKTELTAFKKALKIWKTQVVPINEAISYQAMFFVERYCLSHSLFLADALIAATAGHLGEPLLTANTRRYSMIPEITIKQFRPE